MFRPNWPSPGVLKLEGTAVPPVLLRLVFSIYIMFLNEINVAPPSMPHVLSFFSMPVVCLVCNVDVDDVSD
jgi:hypothetical protein